MAAVEQLTFNTDGFTDKPVRAAIKPILKWAGGKRWLTPRIAEGIHRHLVETDGTYWEPFCGGAALALDLGWRRMVLSDTCTPLMRFYEAVRRAPTQVINETRKLAMTKGLGKEGYLDVRTRFRLPGNLSPVWNAAAFLYLNKLGYNGVYRVNRRGEYNVPYGSDRRDSDPNTLFGFPGIFNASKALAGTSFAIADFRDMIELAQPGDVIFADPPYAQTFSGYSAEGFGALDQGVLADELEAASDRGVVVFATNADQPEIRRAYSWARIFVTKEARAVNQDGKGRGRVGCILAVSAHAAHWVGTA